MSPRYVEIPADRLLAELRDIGEKVRGSHGSCSEGTSGREVVFDLSPPGGRSLVRVFTSLAVGAGAARDCGKDAVRVVVGARVGETEFRPLERGTKILRTAPKAEADRVGAFLARLRENLRAAYLRALKAPACPACGLAMVRRKRKDGSGEFLGCVGYPTCRATKPVAS